MSRIIISKSVPQAPGNSYFVQSITGFDAPDAGENSPFTHNQALISRWLMTSSIAGLFGALVIGSAFFFTYESDQITASNGSQTTRLTSRKLQKSMIGGKADQTEVFIGDVPVIANKNVTADTSPGEQYTNVAVTFGRTKVKSDRLPGAAAALNNDGLSGKFSSGGLAAPDTGTPGISKPGKLASKDFAVLGSFSIGNSISSMLGSQTSKPTVLFKTPAGGNGIDVSGASPRQADTNITRVIKREPHNKPALIPYQTVSVSDGDTLVEILTDHGAFYDDAMKMAAALKPHLPKASLKQGQKVTFALVSTIRNGKKILVPSSLELAISPDKRLTVERTAPGKYALLVPPSEGSDADRFHAQAKIKKSLYLAARNQGIPDNIIVDMMRIHAYDVDFQREVRVGDSFEVFYGDENTFKRSKSGTVLFSSLTLSGNTKNYYRFKTPDDNIVDYYDDNGRSARKFLMRTPLNGARISSGFGMRRHPILGYTRMHKGVDFAAARGTPIKAAGNGIIEQKGGARGYGNYIRIRHANGYKTAYAHMLGYGPGIKAGKRVRQGQVIGYVGSTGRSTGNHLHYEVWVNGKAVNPMRVKVPTGRQLTGKMLALFRKQKNKIDAMRRISPVATRVAAARAAQRDGIN